MNRSWALLIVALGVAAGAFACQAESPPRGPEETCAKACEVHATHCSKHECARGCNLVLDRLTDNQGEPLLGCVARSANRCDDRTWAACATRIGRHADGGPPAPSPPSDEDEE